jgi:hypothetical protein
MARQRKTIDHMRSEARERLTTDPLPPGPVLLPRHLFPYLGKHQTYLLIQMGIIPATQSCEGGVYLIDADGFSRWVYETQ